jgi:hypothetical protein
MQTIDRHGVRVTLPTQGQDIHWARGCDRCRHGLTVTPEHRTYAPLFVERAIQASLGLVQFCDCRAGKAYRAFLRNTFRDLRDGGEYDIKALQDKIAGESAAPSIRYVSPEELRSYEQERANLPVSVGGAAYRA